MRLGEKSSFGRCWLCAGFVGFALVTSFVAVTIYLGEERTDMPPPRFRQVVTRRLLPKTVENAATETTEIENLLEAKSQLFPGPDPISLEEMFPIKKDSIRKKSEAVYPSDWAENRVNKPVIIDPADFSDDFRFPGINNVVHHRPPIPVPPYQYPKEQEVDEAKENPMFTFLDKRLKEAYDYIDAKKIFNADWLDLINSVNQSVQTKNVSVVMEQLKRMYYNASAPELSMTSSIYPSKQSLLSNTSSLVSFGLLAIDLFLLHNVQQIALYDEDSAAQRMKDDPDVLALNALFLPPDKLQNLGRSQEDQEESGIFQDLLELAQGAVTAVGNLGRAYQKTTNPVRGRSTDPTPLDCIWTLYCRNLDKTSKLQGPYGFLAKMNSLGLRLMMGEFPVEQALEKLFVEFTRGPGHISCNKLFPRCSADEAKVVVMNTALEDHRVP